MYYRFGGGNDGQSPQGRLAALNGTLYGTTFWGGTTCGGKCGTVFAITTSGQERVLYSFKGPPTDGNNPISDLVAFNGKLYGTTTGGGSRVGGSGTVFEVDPSGNERVVYSFNGNGERRESSRKVPSPSRTVRFTARLYTVVVTGTMAAPSLK